MPIIEYVFRKSGSVIVGGTSPVKTSRRASLLNIALPFNDFSSPYFSRSGLILAMWLRYSHAFSMFLVRQYKAGPELGRRRETTATRYSPTRSSPCNKIANTHSFSRTVLAVACKACTAQKNPRGTCSSNPARWDYPEPNKSPPA